MRKFCVHAQGVHPLLIHGMSREKILTIGKFKKSDEPAAATTDEACRRALYQDDEGYIVLPTDNLGSAAVAAGQKIKVGSPPRQISTAEGSDLWSYFDITGKFIRILDRDGKPILMPEEGAEEVPWEESVKRGIGKQAKTPTAVCIVRPEFPVWGFMFEGTYNERELSRPKFLDLLHRMGRQGLGSFRPSKGRGKYGIWRPIRVEEETLPDVEENLVVTLDGRAIDLRSESIQLEAESKRGRKKKAAAAGVTTEVDSDGDGEAAPKKRGRPKKVAVNAEDNGEELAVPARS